MSGLLGFIGSCDLDLFDNGLESISHRGPDYRAKKQIGNVVLGYVGLNIFDFNFECNQPLPTESGRYTIVFSGRIYNSQELISKFSLNCLDNASDDAVIVSLFEKIGTDCFVFLNGMFALAIYDSKNNVVFLARDRLGIKPLYIIKEKTFISFSSEIKALSELCSLKNDVNVAALHEWLYYGNTLGDRTLRQSVTKVMPGSFAVLDCATLTADTHNYWSVLNAQKKHSSSINESINDVRTLLKNAVHKQLTNDVTAGVFLSGGIDSSAITAIAGQLLGKKLSTYSVKFDFDKGINELPRAKMIAEMYGTEHHELEIGGYDVADTIIKMIHHHDHPFSDAANIPLYLLSNKVSDKNKVILTGDGGDELFGGYKRYKTLSNLNIMRLLANLANFFGYFMPKNSSFFARQRYINALLSKPDYKLMSLLLTVEDEKNSPGRVFTDPYRKVVESYPYNDRYKEVERKYKNHEIVNRMLFIDTEIILPDIFLEKVDRSTMAASIEVRTPFLDNDLVEFCLSLPSSLKVHRGHKKYLLKKSLEGMVPNEILYGKKSGFGVPFGYWLKGPLKDLFFDELSDFQLRNPGVLDTNELIYIYNRHENGKQDFGFLLWKILNLIIWANTKGIRFES